MNREIKFRVWDKENKEMLKVQELDFEPTFYGGRVAMRPDKYNDYFDTEDMILMQYTEKNDKNGEEIYEGDIVSIKNDNRKAIVEWTDAILGYILSYIGWCDFDYLSDIMELEVIGNIYDNLELLKESD